MPRRKTTLEFIAQSKSIFGTEAFDYTNTAYFEGHTKVSMRCRKHDFEFSVTPSNHYKGYGCPKCREEETGKKGHRTFWDTESVIAEAIKIHGDKKYDFSRIVYNRYLEKVEVFCLIHRESFYPTVSSLIGLKTGCPKCGDERTAKARRSTREAFIKKATAKFGSRFDYSAVEYKNARTKVKIRCVEHNHIFEQAPDKHINSGQVGCYYCNTNAPKTTEIWITEARAVHGEDYGYDRAIYKDSKGKVEIYCRQHDEYFWQGAGVHLSGCGCPRCGDESGASKIRATLESFVEQSNEVHGEGTYDYSAARYINSKTKLTIYCNKHKVHFAQEPTSHLAGSGCPKCGLEAASENKIGGYNLTRALRGDFAGAKDVHLYLITMKKDEEFFFKVGICSNEKPKKRMWEIARKSGYTCKMFKYVTRPLETAVVMEQLALQRYSNYQPKEQFDGYTECLTEVPDFDALEIEARALLDKRQTSLDLAPAVNIKDIEEPRAAYAV